MRPELPLYLALQTLPQIADVHCLLLWQQSLLTRLKSLSLLNNITVPETNKKTLARYFHQPCNSSTLVKHKTVKI